MRLAVIGSTGLVGSQVVAHAESRGNFVTGISKASGVNLLDGTGVKDALAGIDTIINVIQSPSLEQQASTEFFTTVAANLGQAANAAGVRRTVVLSIIGVDRVADQDEVGTGYDGYYRAKFAQEEATREHAPGAQVVRSAQFHDIAGQAIGWGRAGDTTTVPDLLIEPVAVPAMVEVLVDVATGDRDADLIEVAGPQMEQLAAMSSAFAQHEGDPVRVQPAPVGDAVRRGILLPSPGAVLVGPTFDEWLMTRP